MVEMDADFSHDPADLPRCSPRREAPTSCSARATSPAAGSAMGAAAAGDQPRRQRLRPGRARARRPRPDRRLQVLPARGAGGDRPRHVGSRGYAFQVETTYRAIGAGFRVVEVPIVFRDRRVGNSKMSRAIVAEASGGSPRCASRIAGLERPVAARAHMLSARTRPQSGICFTLYSIDRHKDKEEQRAGKLPDVTDANFQAEVLEADGPCSSTSGPLVRALPRRPPDPRGDDPSARTSRSSPSTSTRTRRPPPVRGPLDPDDDPLQGRRARQADRRRDAEGALEAELEPALASRERSAATGGALEIWASTKPASRTQKPPISATISGPHEGVVRPVPGRGTGCRVYCRKPRRMQPPWRPTKKKIRAKAATGPPSRSSR